MVVQQTKAFATKLDNLCSISEFTWWKEREGSKLSFDFHVCTAYMCMRTHTPLNVTRFLYVALTLPEFVL